MEHDVIISVKGTQHFPGQEPDSTELITRGTLTAGPDGYTLSYQESELTGLGCTRTVFRILPGEVTLTRTGDVNLQLVFQEGRRNLSLYETPYGSFSVGIDTRRLRLRMDDTGGEMEIDYSIEINHVLHGSSAFHISVRPSGAPGQEKG